MRYWIMLDVLSLHSRVWRPEKNTGICGQSSACSYTPSPLISSRPPSHLPIHFVHLPSFLDTFCICMHTQTSPHLCMYMCMWEVSVHRQIAPTPTHSKEEVSGCISGLGTGWWAIWLGDRCIVESEHAGDRVCVQRRD